MYGLTAFSDEEKEVYKDAAEFAQKMDKQLTTDGPDKKGFDLLKGLSEIAVGAPQADGSKAVVPTSAFLTLGGKRMRFQGVARMIEQDGTWKLDTTEGGPDVPAKVIGQLLGQKTDVSSAEPAK